MKVFFAVFRFQELFAPALLLLLLLRKNKGMKASSGTWNREEEAKKRYIGEATFAVRLKKGRGKEQ